MVTHSQARTLPDHLGSTLLEDLGELVKHIKYNQQLKHNQQHKFLKNLILFSSRKKEKSRRKAAIAMILTKMMLQNITIF
jgi:hypothetical protein